MPLSKILLNVFLFPLLIYCTQINAQCPAPVSAAACTGSEPLVIANETLTTGITKWYYGSATTMNSLTLRGGKLIICGDLTIDKFYMDSGQVIVNPGARLVIASGDGAGMILKGNSSMYNFGTLEIQRNLSLESGWATPAAPNIIVNATASAVFKMSNQYFVINNPNSWFVNKGKAEFWGIITDAQSVAGCVCLGITSTTAMAVLINKIPDTYTVSLGSACLYVHQFSQFYGKLTSSRGLMVCLSSSHTSDSGCLPFGCTPNNWGDARVFTNCSSCGSLVALAVQFNSFTITEHASQNILKWQLDNGAGDYIFYIERSADGKNFYILDSVRAGSQRSFSYIDMEVPFGTNYYRIRGVELYSHQTLASKVLASVGKQLAEMRIYPSPFAEYFFISPVRGESVLGIIVLDMAGNNIPVTYRREGADWRVTPLKLLPKQMLMVRVTTNTGTTMKKIMTG